MASVPVRSSRGAHELALQGLKRLKNRSRRGEVIDEVRRAILTGDLAPGSRLPETHLAARLGVSRPTVREAIRELVRERILTEEAYKGVRVASLPADQLLDVFEVRSALETLACQKIAAQRGPDQELALRAALEDLSKAVATGSAKATHAAHLRFHGTLYELSGVELLRALWSVIQSQVNLTITVVDLEKEGLGKMVSNHERFARVLLRGNQAEVTQAVKSHLGEGIARVNRAVMSSVKIQGGHTGRPRA
jgi:DNA-binding GntR family transcriptional regulator